MARVTHVKKIAIIGAGHMGRALRDGFVRSGVARSHVLMSDSSRTNARAVRGARFVFIAVKPSIARSVITELRAELRGKTVISLAAGVPLAKLRVWAGRGVNVARIMPNIPVAIGRGVIGVYAPGNGDSMKKLLAGLGLVVPVKNERALETLTLIGGCGPGIAAYCIGLLAEAGGEEVAVAVFEGAVAHLNATGLSPHALMNSVATKGGVTEAILSTLEKKKTRAVFMSALAAGRKRLKKIRV